MAGSNNNAVSTGIVTTQTNTRNLSDGNPIGTSFGLSPADLISHYGVAPVAQFGQPVAPNATTAAAGAATGVFTNTTFTGGVGTTAYSIGDVVAMLKAQGLLA